MNILHIGLMVNGRNEGLSKAFRDIADNYAEFPPNHNLVNQVKGLDFKPDIIFCQIQDDKIRNGRDVYSTVSILKEAFQGLDSFIVNWTGDMRDSTPQWIIEFAPFVSVTAFSNQRDVDYIRSKGHRSEFLQIGIDPVTFKKWQQPEGMDIVFMGNHNGHFPLSSERMRVVNTIKNYYGSKFAVYGNGYPGSRGSLNANGNDPFPIQSQESKIYNSAKIGISVSHYNSDRYVSDRLLRIMGSNCFALSHHFEGIEKDFEVGKHLDTFKNHNELVSKIKFYLENPSKREEIRDNGFKLVHTMYTYSNMVDNIIYLSKTQ